MITYTCPTAVQQAIPVADVTPLERFLLGRIFDATAEGFHLYLCSAEGPDLTFVVPRHELVAAFTAPENDPESTAFRVIKTLLEDPSPSRKTDDYTYVDLTETSWDVLLQDILRRSPTLSFIAVFSSFESTSPRLEGLGGMVVLITRDAISGKTTSDVLDELLDDHGLDAATA